MPEGDTIHQVAHRLRDRLQGVTLRGGRLRDLPRTRFVGRRVREIYAHGKHLLIAFDDGEILRSHLGMYGSWHRYPRGRPWRRPKRQAAIELETEGRPGDVFVCFNAKEVEMLREGGVREKSLHHRLGQDLLARDVELEGVVPRARALLEPGEIIADVLLDQRVASGIGNVYKNELLFLGGVHPETALSHVEDAALLALFENARELLRRNLAGGPRVTRFAHDGLGRHWVYGRRGLACLRCRSVIRYGRTGKTGRSTYWCPRCQGGRPRGHPARSPGLPPGASR